jgi:predicted Zn-dependent protease
MRAGLLKAVSLAGLCFAGAGASCATNPVTGQRELSLISEGQEIQMGREAAQGAAESIGLVDDAALQSYVGGIGTRLAAASERPQLPWSFRVVDDPTPNAFALPGGFIFLTRGLLSLMDSEAELASVLGHEIGHVTARHSVSQLSRAQLAQIGLGVGMVLLPDLAAVGNIAGAGLQLLFLKYGRDDERQADELGFKYALNQNYDMREMADVFRALERAGEKEGHSPLPSWLATHPNPGERVEATNARIAALNRPLTGLNVGRQEYLNRLQGMVYGVNPRNGFFRGSSFLHPDLRFRIDFPQGWQFQNMTQAVMAGSPQQDALIQLTLAQGANAEAAARQFLGQQGITSSTPTRETINNLPAVAARFDAQTQQGVLRGLAVFITHGGRTYQLLGFTPAERFSSYERVLSQSFRTFAQLTDQQALNVQPNRIEIVRVPQNMTLAQFHQRFPSVIDIGELALINQVSEPSSMLAEGIMAKRVVVGR